MNKFILLFLHCTILNFTTTLFASNYTVNIDKAHFRKLTIGINPFTNNGGGDLSKKQQQIKNELKRLLKFTRIFNPITLNNKTNIKDTRTNRNYWRTLGVDIIINGSIKKDGKKYNLDLIVSERSTNRLLIKENYKIKYYKDFKLSLKKFVDLIIIHFTKRSGFFQSKIVFIGRKYKSSQKKVYTCDPDGSNVKLISQKNTLHVAPNISHDGAMITYTSYQTNYPNLYLYNSYTKKADKISKSNALSMGGTFSPNNKLILYSPSKNGNTEIHLQNITTKKSDGF